MEAKELMIGDWCAYGVNCKGRVTALTEHLITLSVDGNEVNGLYMLMPDMIRPIPLTEDILVKNGFVFNKGYAVLQVSEDTYLDFYKHEHRLRKVWKGIDEWNNHAKVRDVTFVCQCYYVHEFQHALRLCNIDKEISI